MTRPLDSNGNEPLPGQTDIFEMLEVESTAAKPTKRERIRRIVNAELSKGERDEQHSNGVQR